MLLRYSVGDMVSRLSRLEVAWARPSACPDSCAAMPHRSQRRARRPAATDQLNVPAGIEGGCSKRLSVSTMWPFFHHTIVIAMAAGSRVNGARRPKSTTLRRSRRLCIVARVLPPYCVLKFVMSRRPQPARVLSQVCLPLVIARRSASPCGIRARFAK